MKAIILLFGMLYLLISVSGLPLQNLGDQVVRQEQVVQTVNYKGRTLNVWKQDINNYTRYYVTPLCNIDLDSLDCGKDDYSAAPRWVFSFDVKLWDYNVTTVVQKALKVKNIMAHAGDILVLPMESVRVTLGNPNPNMEIDDNWRSFAIESFMMSFQIYPKDKAICKKMIKDAKTKTDFFLNTLKLMFEFTMVASTTSSRHVTIKSNFSQKSSFVAKLINTNAPDGTVFLTSNDTNNLAHEVFNSVIYDEEVSSDYQPSQQEGAIIKELLKSFESDKIQSVELSKEDWDSVFWDNIYTRPDIQTSFLNDTMTYDNNENLFKMDKNKARAFLTKLASAHSDGHTDSANLGGMFEGLGLSVGGSHGEEHSEASSSEDGKKSIDSIKLETFLQGIKKSRANVEWTGEKFQQKNLDLHRINTKNLNSISETAFNRVILNKEESGQQIEIKKQTNATDFDHIYDEITIPSPPATISQEQITTPPTTTTAQEQEKQNFQPGRRGGRLGVLG